MRRRSTTWMWAEACQMLARTERLRQRFFEVESGSMSSAADWEAPVDMFEHGRELVVWVALPGVAPESIQIRLQGSRLSVTGVRSLRIEPRTARIRRLEIPHGRLVGRVELPAEDYVLEARDALHGCVRLSLRKA